MKLRNNALQGNQLQEALQKFEVLQLSKQNVINNLLI